MHPDRRRATQPRQHHGPESRPCALGQVRRCSRSCTERKRRRESNEADQARRRGTRVRSQRAGDPRVLLSRPSTALEVSPTAVGGFLRELIGIDIPTASGSRANTILAVDSRQVVVATSRTPTGQTVPISDVVAAMDLLRREGAIDVTVDVLGYRSAFIGAVLLQLPGARAEGTAPTRIVIADSLVAGPTDLGISSSRDVELGPFQGALDRPVTARQRREQRRLRSALLRGRDEAPCALCGETYPARFLGVAHQEARHRLRGRSSRLAEDRDARMHLRVRRALRRRIPERGERHGRRDRESGSEQRDRAANSPDPRAASRGVLRKRELLRLAPAPCVSRLIQPGLPGCNVIRERAAAGNRSS